ncbi:MAG: ABC transporter permease [Spirochaetales bacterium]|nr:ABC transporter permease [Spirochaetales bacterium]MCF7938322.1 ABC transporter permease [Spirochaetales bacterium]
MQKRNWMTRELVLIIIVVAFMLFLSVSTNFSSRSGIYSFMLDVSPTIVAAIALAMVIFTGNIDISAGTISGFVAYTAGSLAKSGMPLWIFLPAGMLIGMLLAGLNGFITVKFKVPSIVVTLAMNMVHIGFYATFLPQSGWIENLGTNFTWFGRGRFFELIPYTFVGAIAVAILFMFIMKYTKFGMSLYAVGGNRRSAVYSGINPDRTVMKVFLVEGLLLGISAVMKATTRSEVMPSVFVGRELFFIAAALVGGVSIFGGVGKIVGALFGAMLVYLLSIAMIYLGFQDYYQFAIQGGIILIAVYITVIDVEKMKKTFRRKKRHVITTGEGE